MGDVCDTDDDNDGVIDSEDCAPLNAAIYPGATDICNDIDDDCDELIDEDCPDALPEINIENAEVYESDGSVSLKVTLTKPAQRTVKVAFTTVNGTAVSVKGKKSNGDYVATKGVLSMQPGDISANISVIIIHDQDNTEGDEYFTVVLSNPSNNASLADATGVVIIHNSSPAPTTVEGKKPISNEMENVVTELVVKAIPNPSSHYFTVFINGNSYSPIKIRVLDALGRTVETGSMPASGNILRIGERYRQGFYYLEVVQGNERRIVKLIKASD